LNVAGVERHLDPQLFYRVRDFEQHRGKHVVVLGGSNSALDWELNLVGVAESVTLLHRSEWGLELTKHQINVDMSSYETSAPGIYAGDDICHYPDKKN